MKADEDSSSEFFVTDGGEYEAPYESVPGSCSGNENSELGLAKTMGHGVATVDAANITGSVCQGLPLPTSLECYNHIYDTDGFAFGAAAIIAGNGPIQVVVPSSFNSSSLVKGDVPRTHSKLVGNVNVGTFLGMCP